MNCFVLVFFFAGIIPRSWRRYIVPASLTVIQWVTDFSERIKQLQNVSKQVAGSGSKVLKVCVPYGDLYDCTTVSYRLIC